MVHQGKNPDIDDEWLVNPHVPIKFLLNSYAVLFVKVKVSSEAQSWYSVFKNAVKIICTSCDHAC